MKTEETVSLRSDHASRRASARVLGIGAVLLTLAGAGTSLVIGGPLDPPAGPVASTFKTLTEVEPRIPLSQATTQGDADSVFKITQSGSYYLTGNVTGVAGKSGIEVAASNVTIDLCGYTLQGVSGSGGGIRVAVSPVRRLTVRNGYIVGWTSSGIAHTPTSGSPGGDLYEGVTSSGNGSNGFVIAEGTRMVNCTASENGLRGFSGASVTLIGCTATANNVCGFDLFKSTLSNCVSNDNTGDGFQLEDGSIAEHCVATHNGGRGFLLSVSKVVSSSAMLNGSTGIELSGGIVEMCAAIDCDAISNTSSGILANGQGSITRCRTRGNGVDGVRVSDHCTITECQSHSNAVDGFHLLGTGNRIEGCDARLNARGYNVLTSANFIIKNSAGGNTTANYTITANNRVGTVVVPPATPSVNGNSGAPGGLGTTDPWANISY